jgi:hypothetical protein
MQERHDVGPAARVYCGDPPAVRARNQLARLGFREQAILSPYLG